MGENKEHFCAEEYDRLKKDTRAQLAEFEDSLQKMISGNLTLQSELEATKLAIRAAISDAFKTPQVIRLFAQKQPAALRRRLDEIDRDVKLGKVQFDDVAEQVCMPKREDRSSKGKESKGGCPTGWMGEGEAWTDRTALGKARIRLMGIV